MKVIFNNFYRSCSDIDYIFDNKSSYLGMMVASAVSYDSTIMVFYLIVLIFQVFSWIATALLAVMLVLVGAPLKSKLSHLKLSDIKKPLLKR